MSDNLDYQLKNLWTSSFYNLLREGQVRQAIDGANMAVDAYIARFESNSKVGKEKSVNATPIKPYQGSLWVDDKGNVVDRVGG